MGRSAQYLFAGMALLAIPAVPAAADTAKGDVRCAKTVSGMGTPHRIKTIAQFNAVRAWTELSKKRGHDYGHWHNARGSRIECKKPERSDYYSCQAKASPCRSPKTAAAEKRK